MVLVAQLVRVPSCEDGGRGVGTHLTPNLFNLNGVYNPTGRGAGL